jgi:two-component system cell cycle sensor histidine kinase/response regulator CckA
VTHYDRDELAITLFEESGDALFLFDPISETMIDVNPMAQRLSGFPYGELLRMKVTQLFRSSGPSGLQRLRHAYNRTGLFHSQEDFLLRHAKDDLWVPVNLTVTRLHARPKTLGLITARDISERQKLATSNKQLEEQLRQSQKMEAVGQLAGGVAHDFNNLLTVILGHGSLLLQQTQPGDAIHEGIRIISSTAERAAALTRQLLAFSRKQLLMPVMLNLNTVVSELVPMLHRLIGEDIRLHTDLAENLGPIMADRHQLEQVLMNLVVNARDAMPTGGLLTIHTHEEQENVVLTVRDTGQGMDEHTRAHLFEPFFTTKGVGKGTGLGLATVYGIVQQSGGSITVDSAPGKGATFRIELPRVAASEERRTGSVSCRVECLPNPAANAAGSPPSRKEAILLVEDEEMLRNLSRMVLHKHGYTVLEAAHGAEALAICQSHEGTIDLMVTDVVMPILNGSELADCVAQLRPDTKVLYVSGYTDDAVVRNGVSADTVPFLHKPFTPDDLVAKVREVLDDNSASGHDGVESVERVAQAFLPVPHRQECLCHPLTAIPASSQTTPD